MNDKILDNDVINQQDNSKDEEMSSNIQSIRTLETDLADVVNNNNYGKNIIKIITDPFKKTNNSAGDDLLPNNKKKLLYSIVSIIIFIIVFIVLFNMYTPKVIQDIDKNTPSVDANSSSTQVLLDTKDIINPELIHVSDFSKLNRSEIVEELHSIISLYSKSKIKDNTNIQIKNNISIYDFFDKIRYSGGSNLLRSIDSEYNFGYIYTQNKFEGYLLIKINNFDLAFKSILDWENYMYTDMEGILYENKKDTNTATTTQTLSDKNLPKENIFIDKIVKNTDTREYTDSISKSKILYGFINNKYLLITSGPNSFMDIKDSLINQNILR